LWLQEQKNKAKTEKDQAMWDRWDIVEADLDEDKTTPDNVVTFSDRARGKIRAVDGYELMPRASKEVNRTFYSNFPNPRDRHRIDDKTRRELRSWYRKYPYPQEQADHPFNEYVPDLSPYQIIREAVQAQLEGFRIYINCKDRPDGQLSAKHYMPLLQKITGYLHLTS
jgi:hypothetical protein